jgi:hypothetical protein
VNRHKTASFAAASPGAFRGRKDHKTSWAVNVAEHSQSCDDRLPIDLLREVVRDDPGYYWSALGRLDSPQMQAMVKYLETMDYLPKTPRSAR